MRCVASVALVAQALVAEASKMALAAVEAMAVQIEMKLKALRACCYAWAPHTMIAAKHAETLAWLAWAHHQDAHLFGCSFLTVA